MLVWWYFGLIIGMIYCEDNDPLPIENEPEARVMLIVDTGPKSSIDTKNFLEPFACHECMNCQEKSNLTTRTCQFGINMCFTIHKRINNANQIIRRGCSIAKEQCIVPDDYQLNSFDSITCCTSHKCNQGIQFRPLIFLLILNLLIMMICI